MLSYLGEHPEYRKFMKTVLVSDEVFFQTLFMAFPFKDNRNDYLTFIAFKDDKASPETLTMEYLPELKKSNYHICRKLDMDLDQEFFETLKALSDSLDDD